MVEWKVRVDAEGFVGGIGAQVGGCAWYRAHELVDLDEPQTLCHLLDVTEPVGAPRVEVTGEENRSVVFADNFLDRGELASESGQLLATFERQAVDVNDQQRVIAGKLPHLCQRDLRRRDAEFAIPGRRRGLHRGDSVHRARDTAGVSAQG